MQVWTPAKSLLDMRTYAKQLLTSDSNVLVNMLHHALAQCNHQLETHIGCPTHTSSTTDRPAAGQLNLSSPFSSAAACSLLSTNCTACGCAHSALKPPFSSTPCRSGLPGLHAHWIKLRVCKARHVLRFVHLSLPYQARPAAVVSQGCTPSGSSCARARQDLGFRFVHSLTPSFAHVRIARHLAPKCDGHCKDPRPCACTCCCVEIHHHLKIHQYQTVCLKPTSQHLGSLTFQRKGSEEKEIQAKDGCVHLRGPEVNQTFTSNPLD